MVRLIGFVQALDLARPLAFAVLVSIVATWLLVVEIRPLGFVSTIVLARVLGAVPVYVFASPIGVM